MTCYVGSRASGYPPDPVPFRRCAGAPRRLRPHRKRGRFRASSPSSSWESCSGRRHGVGRDSPRVMIVLSRATVSSGPAAPTRATLQRAPPESNRSQRPDFSAYGAEKALARGRASASSFGLTKIWLYRAKKTTRHYMALLSHFITSRNNCFATSLHFFRQYIAACYTLAYENKRFEKVSAAATGLAETGTGGACSVHGGNRAPLQRTLSCR